MEREKFERWVRYCGVIDQYGESRYAAINIARLAWNAAKRDSKVNAGPVRASGQAIGQRRRQAAPRTRN